MAFIRCNLSGGGVKIAWVKLASYPNTITAKNCDYMICTSSRTNLANDVLREVLNAKLIKSENVSGSYDVALYNDVTSATTIKQMREHSETIVIGIDVG